MRIFVIIAFVLASQTPSGSRSVAASPSNADAFSHAALDRLESLELLHATFVKRTWSRQERLQTWFHAASDRLRRLDAHRRQSAPSQVSHRARLAVLVQWARGGAAKALWQSFQRAPQSRDAHLLRFVARRQLEIIARDRQLRTEVEAQTIAAALAAADEAALATIEEAVGAGVVAVTESMRAHVRRRGPSEDEVQREVEDAREHSHARSGGFALRAPVTGAVVAPFGDALDPVTHVVVRRRGIELTARAFAPVVAPHAGRVVWADQLAGHAHVVVLEDPTGRYQTLTGRLWRPTVAVGDEVEAGEVLGHVAPKQLPDGLGETIYLEVRLGERPLDPVPLLSQR